MSATATLVLGKSSLKIGGNSSVEAAIGAFEDVDKVHNLIIGSKKGYQEKCHFLQDALLALKL